MNTFSFHNSDITIPKACLGTMSFGAHVDEKTAIEIMDTSVEMGCNFFDTAEMYAVPPMPETFGVTEEIIGRWMQERNNRKDIILATKVVGSERGMSWIRGGETRLNKEHITKALTGSFSRLQTDYIDLYQLHWPDRKVNKFGERNFQVPENDNETIEIEETLSVLADLQKQGLIKHIGISNETPWGAMEFIRLAKEKNLPMVSTIQNNYSLLTRSYETGLSEISHKEALPLLAYSPLAYGALVEEPRKGGRFDVYPDFVPRYQSTRVKELVEMYKTLAHKNDMTVSQLAIAFVASQSFVGSVIIGPATVAQTKEGIEACSLKLSPEILAEIEAIHELQPNICA